MFVAFHFNSIDKPYDSFYFSNLKTYLFGELQFCFAILFFGTIMNYAIFRYTFHNYVGDRDPVGIPLWLLAASLIDKYMLERT